MIRKLTVNDVEQFCGLIVDMYSNLENLEWFSPMPYDYENVKSIVENPRFYVVGYFCKDILCAVSSFDYKCGKLIGKVEFPEYCDTSKLVEFGFTMVHSNYRGNGIMKQLVGFLLNEAKKQGYEWAFGKVHKDNFASSKSLIYNGFEIVGDYSKPVKVEDFKSLSTKDFFSQKGKENANITLSRVSKDEEEFIVDYNIILRKI